MKITFVNGMGLQLPVPLLSISYLAGAVKASGRHSVSLVDCYLRRHKTRYVLERLREEKPDVIAFSVMSVYVDEALRMAEEIRKAFPAVPIICGGIHAILRPEEILGCKAVNAVCVGEGEDVLVEFLDRLERKETMPAVRGFWYNTSGGIVRNKGIPVITDLDSLAYPDWDIWDMDIYMHSMMYVIASRGCPFSCAYCSSAAVRKALCTGDSRLNYRVRSAANIVGEVARNVRRYGRNGFLPVIFSDSNFGMYREQFREFAGSYIREGLHKTAPWRGMVVASVVDDEWAALARASGCYAMDLGLEHSIESVRMGLLGKRLTDGDFSRAIAAFRAHGIPYELSLMIGFKGETYGDILRNILRARRYRPLFFCIHLYHPLPGTAMWERHPLKKSSTGMPYVEKRESEFENRLPLIWAIKLSNQLSITLVALRVHGLRMFALLLAFCRRFACSRGIDAGDFVKLCNHQIQQYCVYDFFAEKIKDGSIPLLRGGFYRRDEKKETVQGRVRD